MFPLHPFAQRSKLFATQYDPSRDDQSFSSPNAIPHTDQQLSVEEQVKGSKASPLHPNPFNPHLNRGAKQGIAPRRVTATQLPSGPTENGNPSSDDKHVSVSTSTAPFRNVNGGKTVENEKKRPAPEPLERAPPKRSRFELEPGGATSRERIDRERNLVKEPSPAPRPPANVNDVKPLPPKRVVELLKGTKISPTYSKLEATHQQLTSEDLRSLRRRLWAVELETIRRPEPIYSPPDGAVTKLTARIGLNQTSSVTGGGSLSRNDGFISDDTHHGTATTITWLQDARWYGTNVPEKELEYQIRDKHLGRIPGPGALRLDLEKLAEQQGCLVKADLARVKELPAATCNHTGEARDIDCSLRGLLENRDTCTLTRGFPLMEDVDFAVFGNRHGGFDCYWDAVAMLLYGDPERGVRVKAEHLDFLDLVLRNEKHPMHERFRKLNANFYKTQVALAGAQHLNLFQSLHVRGCWTNAIMAEVTAAAYGVFVVLFSVQDQKVTEVAMRGAYGSRHIFLVFSGGNHFQPMVPNEFYWWEFQCPRLLPEDVEFYDARKKRRDKESSVGLSWRNEHKGLVAPPMPIDIDLDLNKLALVWHQADK
jgi:hypothetical protein